MASYTVAQNTSFLTGASILQKIISFAYFTLIARIIGVGDTGLYFFAITFTTIFTVVADFGLAPVLTREASRHPDDAGKLVNTIFWSKAAFGIIAYLLVVILVNAMQYPADTKSLVYLSGLTMFFDNLHSVFYSIFRARKNLIYESIGIVASQFLTLIIGTTALLLKWPLIWLIAAYTIPAALNTLYSGIFARRVYSLRYAFSWDKSIFKLFIIMAFPFALAGILGRLYSYSDSIIMSKILTLQELGWWSVPYKITFAFQFIPLALAASVYPVMSGLHPNGRDKIGELFVKSWRYLLILVLPLSFGLFVLAEPVILKVYNPQYSPSVPVLRILAISLIFGFLSFITGALLNATNKQKTQTALVGVSLATNIILNIIFLPRIGIMGAAYSALTSNIVLCLGGYFLASRQILLPHFEILKHLVKALIPAGAMALVVYLALRAGIHFVAVVPIGGMVYAVLLFVSGEMNMKTLYETKNKILGKINNGPSK